MSVLSVGVGGATSGRYLRSVKQTMSNNMHRPTTASVTSGKVASTTPSNSSGDTSYAPKTATTVSQSTSGSDVSNASQIQEYIDKAISDSYEFDQESREWSANEAQKARDWSERMSNTSYQRAVQDLIAAGLNPALAYSQGGASTPSASSASGDYNNTSGVVNSALSASLEDMKLQSAEKVASIYATASMYSADASAGAICFSALKSLEGVQYSANNLLEGTQYTANKNFLSQQFNRSNEYAMNQINNAVKLYCEKYYPNTPWSSIAGIYNSTMNAIINNSKGVDLTNDDILGYAICDVVNQLSKSNK